MTNDGQSAMNCSRRRFLTVAGMTAGAALLSACGGSEPEPTPTLIPTATLVPAPLEKTKLSYWQYLTQFEKVETRLFEIYGKRFKAIEVEPTFIAAPEYWSQLDAALASGTGPDVWNTTPDIIWDRALAGQVADVTTALTRDYEMTLAVDGMYLASLDLYKMGDKHFAAPRDFEMPVAYLNHDLLGDVPSDNDWKVEDLQAAVASVSSGGVLGLEPVRDVRLLDALIASQGGAFCEGDISRDLAGMSASYSSAASCKALSVWLDLATAEKGAAEQPTEVFKEGKAAIAFGWPSLMLELEDAAFAWDVLPLPGCAAGQTSLASGHGLALNANGEHPVEAWALLLWICDPGTGKSFLDKLNTMPVLTAYTESPDFLDRIPGKNMAAFSALANATIDPYTVGYSQWKGAQQAVWDQALTGALAADDACAETDKAINAEWDALRAAL